MQLKQLCKILEKNSRLEILKYVAVKSGVARVTNLEVSAEMPCDLPDGLYYGKAWERGQFIACDDQSLVDYPEIPSPSGKPLLSLQSEDIARVIDACGDKWSLSGFLLDYTPKGEYLAVASDGHRLHCSGEMNLVKTKAKTSQLIAHRRAWALLSMQPSWTVRCDAHNIFFASGDITVSSRIIDEKFPNYRSVLPELSRHYAIGNEDLLDCMACLHRECNRIGSQSRNNGLSLYRRENNTLGIYRHDAGKGKTFRMESGIPCEQSVHVALNGAYISDIDGIEGEKTVYWQDNDSSLVVAHKRGMCVVMPLNL